MKKLAALLLIGTLSLSAVGCAEDFWEDDAVVEEAEPTEEVEATEEASESGEEITEASDEEMDLSAEETESIAEAAENVEENTACPYENNPQLTFVTEDINGNTVNSSDYADKTLIMVNFWEPWCGPCVGEMPDLEKLYEEYQSEGFIIIGAFSTEGEDGDVLDVMDYCGTTYPIVRTVNSMVPFMTDYVPTTIFMDSHGHVLTDEPYVGANSYDDWKSIIEQYLAY